MTPSAEADRELAASAPVDELRQEMDEVTEYRWMAATAVCCAVGLVTATILITTGDRFDLRPTAPLSSLDDRFAGSFDALDTKSASRPSDGTVGSTTGSVEPPSHASGKTITPQKRRRIVMRLKSPWCSGGLTSQSFYRCRTHSW